MAVLGSGSSSAQLRQGWSRALPPSLGQGDDLAGVGLLRGQGRHRQDAQGQVSFTRSRNRAVGSSACPITAHRSISSFNLICSFLTFFLPRGAGDSSPTRMKKKNVIRRYQKRFLTKPSLAQKSCPVILPNRISVSDPPRVEGRGGVGTKTIPRRRRRRRRPTDGRD